MSETEKALEPKCPVCSARFREQPVCSRCGADLRLLMQVAARAWVARAQCRAALRAGRLDNALAWDGVARGLQNAGIPAPPRF